MLSTVLAAGAGAEPRAMRALSAKSDAKPKAVVHVGPHKMGSTSLQELIFLPENINITRTSTRYRRISDRHHIAPRGEQTLRSATRGRLVPTHLVRRT